MQQARNLIDHIQDLVATIEAGFDTLRRCFLCMLPRSISTFLFALVLWLCSGQITLAQCVQVALINDSGNIITPGGLVTGFKIGEDIVFDIKLPPHREQKEARSAPCPPGLVTEVRALYNRSCTSDRARQQAAVTNNTNIRAVTERCTQLRSSLSKSR